MYHREYLRQICAHRMKIIIDIDCEHRVITCIIESIWDKFAHIDIPVRIKEDLTWLTYSDYTWLDRLSKVIRSCRPFQMRSGLNFRSIQEFMWSDRFAINAYVCEYTLCRIILYSICIHHMSSMYITYIPIYSWSASQCLLWSLYLCAQICLKYPL